MQEKAAGEGVFKCMYLKILNGVCGSHYVIWTALMQTELLEGMNGVLLIYVRTEPMVGTQEYISV